MHADTRRELFTRLHDVAAKGSELEPHTTRLSARLYSDPAALERELDTLFRAAPIAVAHVDELPEPGSVLRTRLGRLPVLVARDRSDAETIRVFINACRHRGAELLELGAKDTKEGVIEEGVAEEVAVCRKALTCRYHAWSYGLDGRLLHIPNEEAFAPLDHEALGLVELPSQVRHGFVWARASGPAQVEAFLGPELEADFTAFGLEHHGLTKTRVHERASNWKLVFEAFSEGYHVNSLHRTSIARYFASATLCDAFGPHTRQVGARKNLAARWEDFDLSSQTTVFYTLFPCAVIVHHPTWLMHLSMIPLSPRRVRVVHRMLVDRRAAQDEQAVAERMRSFEFIDHKILQAEDLSICESLQRSYDAGAIDEILIGNREAGVRVFHEARTRWLSS